MQKKRILAVFYWIKFHLMSRAVFWVAYSIPPLSPNKIAIFIFPSDNNHRTIPEIMQKLPDPFLFDKLSGNWHKV